MIVFCIFKPDTCIRDVRHKSSVVLYKDYAYDRNFIRIRSFARPLAQGVLDLVLIPCPMSVWSVLVPVFLILWIFFEGIPGVIGAESVPLARSPPAPCPFPRRVATFFLCSLPRQGALFQI